MDFSRCKVKIFQHQIIYKLFSGFKFVKNAGRLATQASAPYTGKGQLSCNYRASTNGMTKGRVTSYKTTDKTDNGLMSASSQGLISVAMLVVDSFYMYKSGKQDYLKHGHFNQTIVLYSQFSFPHDIAISLTTLHWQEFTVTMSV